MFWGHGSDALSMAEALLSYWCSEMKRKVSHTVIPSRFIQLRSHLHFLKTSKSVAVGVESQRQDTEASAGKKNPESPFKLNIKLAFMWTSSTVTDMNNALHSRVIGLICSSNFKTNSFMGLFSVFLNILSHEFLMQPHMHPLCIWFAHIFMNNSTTVCAIRTHSSPVKNAAHTHEKEKNFLLTQ